MVRCSERRVAFALRLFAHQCRDIGLPTASTLHTGSRYVIYAAGRRFCSTYVWTGLEEGCTSKPGTETEDISVFWVACWLSRPTSYPICKGRPIARRTVTIVLMD